MTGAAQILGSRDKSEAGRFASVAGDWQRMVWEESGSGGTRRRHRHNEGKRREIQSRIDRAAETRESRNGGKAHVFAHPLPVPDAGRVVDGGAFQLARPRRGVLADQRDVIGCMWRMLAAAGVSRRRAVDAAKREESSPRTTGAS